MSSQPQVTVYTDGGCKPNPGPGGWGAVLLYGEGKKKRKKELKGAEEEATNNRMELRAAIEALKYLDEGHEVSLTTDSQYLRKGVTEWMAGWQRKGWMTASGSAVKNRDLWQELQIEIERHKITWKWTRGHSGNRYNERADQLASSMLPGETLSIDDNEAVHLFTAAAYSGKAKAGAWAVVMRYQEHRKSFSGRITDTTANRMHIVAALQGFEQLKRPVRVHLYTVSDYLRDGATKWIKAWRSRGWQTKEGKPVSHKDLWQELDALNRKYEAEWHVVPRDDLPEDLEEAKSLATEAVKK